MWLVSRYSVGAPTEAKGKVIIPVAYNRLGLYCDNFYFEPGQKTTTIRYELVRRQREWRIDGPIPDYPDLGADVLVSSLEAMARNPNETPEKRAKAETMAHKITEILPSLRNVAPIEKNPCQVISQTRRFTSTSNRPRATLAAPEPVRH